MLYERLAEGKTWMGQWKTYRQNVRALAALRERVVRDFPVCGARRDSLHEMRAYVRS